MVFVVILDYVASLDEVDRLLPDHVSWLNANYEAGLFLASGRREPRTGGVILASGARDAVESALAKDPFALGGVARHTLIEFHPSAFGGVFDQPELRQALSRR